MAASADAPICAPNRLAIAILSLYIAGNFSDITAVKTIVFAPAAAKQFDALPTSAQFAVENALTRYAISGEGDVKRLIDRPGFRVRIGNYRVIFDETRTIILTLYIGRRTTTTFA